MLYDHRIDNFESIDVNETSVSKERIIFHYCYLAGKGSTNYL